MSLASKRAADDSEHASSPPPSKRAREPIKFIDLLDLSNLSEQRDIAARFSDLAEQLLLEFRLHIRRGEETTLYQFLEIEFYLNNAAAHPDPFTHSSQEQRVSGQWYFHKAPTRRKPSPEESATVKPLSYSGYRGGTRKGLDLTFGPSSGSPQPQSPPASSISGGILIRSIRRVSDKKIVSGPSLVVDEILRQSGAPDIKTLVVESWNKRLRALEPPSSQGVSSMWLAPVSSGASKKAETIHTSPRVGLELSHSETTTKLDDPRVVFVGQAYRFYLSPQLLKVNGRLQTFAGLVLPRLTRGKALQTREILPVAIAQGFSETMAKKYIEAFEDGRLNGKLSTFVGASGKNITSSGVRYLHMIATLRQLGVL